MKYTRKTRDEWRVMGLYGSQYGYECVDTLDTRSEAKESIRLYRENERGVSFKLIKKRVKLVLDCLGDQTKSGL